MVAILRRRGLNLTHGFSQQGIAPARLARDTGCLDPHASWHRQRLHYDPCPSGEGARVMPALLAFDTATEGLHIGLSVGERVWLHEGPGGARASSTLIPSVRQLLARAGIALGELDVIGFGRGPGAFTGIRTACSAAQGLAFGANRPVLAIDTLMAVAEDARERNGSTDVWVAMDARMDEIYAAHYRHAGSAWQTVAAPALYGLEALHARWQGRPPMVVAGTATSAFGSRLDVSAARIAADARPAARALLACARADWFRGLATNAALALPVYLRDRVALTTDERAADRQARAAG